MSVVSLSSCSRGDTVLRRASIRATISEVKVYRRTAQRIVVSSGAYDLDGNPATCPDADKGTGRLLDPSPAVLAEWGQQKRDNESRQAALTARLAQQAKAKDKILHDAVIEIHRLVQELQVDEAKLRFDTLAHDYLNS